MPLRTKTFRAGYAGEITCFQIDDNNVITGVAIMLPEQDNKPEVRISFSRSYNAQNDCVFTMEPPSLIMHEATQIDPNQQYDYLFEGAFNPFHTTEELNKLNNLLVHNWRSITYPSIGHQPDEWYDAVYNHEMIPMDEGRLTKQASTAQSSKLSEDLIQALSEEESLVQKFHEDLPLSGEATQANESAE